jgi:hypothetical protein
VEIGILQARKGGAKAIKQEIPIRPLFSFSKAMKCRTKTTEQHKTEWNGNE